MKNGTWLKDPVTGERTAAEYQPRQKPKPKPKPPDEAPAAGEAPAKKVP